MTCLAVENQLIHPEWLFKVVIICSSSVYRLARMDNELILHLVLRVSSILGYCSHSLKGPFCKRLRKSVCKAK
jgi:hypothetical protein